MNNAFNRLALAAALMALLFLALRPDQAHAIPAFPGAEGGGAVSLGGRGGRVIEVINLNNSGAGSLRACLEAAGARTCVFRVGGIIRVSAALQIRNPNLTIAGQTAPGGGILLDGRGLTSPHVVQIFTNNVVMQYIRIRIGRRTGCINECGVSLISYGTGNTIIDHSSFSWNFDDGVTVFPPTHTGPAINNITLSNNLFAEPLTGQGTALFFGGGRPASANLITNIDFHHNLLMSANHRFPLLRLKSARIVNNLFYNPRFRSSRMSGGASVDWIGNKYKAGPINRTISVSEIGILRENVGFSAPGTPSVFISGNVGWHLTNPAGDQYLMARETIAGGGDNGADFGPVPAAWRRGSALAATTHPITVESVNNIEGSILPLVGASRKLDCQGKWVANRDTVDTRLVGEYQSGTGISQNIATEGEVGGFPLIAGGIACPDTDIDGMPNAFEVIKTGGSTISYVGTADADSDGFTNLEEFLAGETGAVEAPVGQKFQNNDRVFVNASSANVRATPGGTLNGTQVQNAQGAVIGGPTSTTNGVVWYNINFDSGTDGWVGQDVLSMVVDADTPPTVAITEPVSGETVQGTSVSVTASASDNTGVLGVQFKLDGANLGAEDTSAPYSTTWDTTLVANGARVLTAVARDSAGNITTSGPSTVTVNNVVTTTGLTLGEISILGTSDLVSGNRINAQPFSLAQRASLESMTVFIQAATGNIEMGVYDDDGASGIPGTLLGSTVDGPPGGTGWRTQSIETPVTLNPGLYWIAFQTDGGVTLKSASTGGDNKRDNHTFGSLSNPFSLTDSNANRYSLYANLSPDQDITAPSVSVTAPSPGEVSGATVSVTGTASDGVGVVGVSFYALSSNSSPGAPIDAPSDSNIIAAEDTTSPYSVVWNTIPVVNGPFNLVAVARDAAGNKTTSAAVAVTVGNTLAAPSALAIIWNAP